MNLLDVGSELLSLEYAPEEADIIMRRLRDIGRVRVTKRATYDVVSVAGESFIRMADWDEPCLVAKNGGGQHVVA